ncbi:hypothetical protein NK214_23030 [Chromobacterium sp. S0633]|uniref:hypothetical protein n=1 Tax=unclassified Chromobacterium TaxID=2641838 RepID=UPI0011B22837|nr:MULTISPECIES: hypothetical protein [unclassified Chromobacterium]MCP1293058.1 hypothetical protein [Chromobacterium sp. S0633]
MVYLKWLWNQKRLNCDWPAFMRGRFTYRYVITKIKMMERTGLASVSAAILWQMSGAGEQISRYRVMSNRYIDMAKGLDE